MKKIFTLLLLSITISGFAQTSFNYKDDFKKILSRTKDSKDSLAYNKLLERFKANDTTLSDFEVLALLIGFTAKPEFKPYQDLDIEKEIYELNDKGKFDDAIKVANLHLQKHPLSQEALIEKSYAFSKLGEKDSSVYYRQQFRRIMQAMDFSGDGKENPIFALGPADGQNYIRKHLSAKIGFMGSGHDINGYFLDMLEVKYKDGTSETLNFIIQHAAEKMFTGEDLKAMEKILEKEEKKAKKKKK